MLDADSDALQFALRVLSAFNQKEFPNPEDEAELRSIAGIVDPEVPIDQIAREVIYKTSRAIRRRLDNQRGEAV